EECSAIHSAMLLNNAIVGIYFIRQPARIGAAHTVEFAAQAQNGVSLPARRVIPPNNAGGA
ncbi:MAG: hypothetical protein ABIV47_16650, partial [Roseiflexaceae bacterium]